MLPHKVWEGRNVFLCGGRIILGHAPKLLPLTLSLLLFTTVYETFFLVPKFSHLAARANGPWADIFVMRQHLFAGFLLLSSIVLFSSFATIVVEPGIIPRPSFLQQPLCSVVTLHMLLHIAHVANIIDINVPDIARHATTAWKSLTTIAYGSVWILESATTNTS